MGISLNRPDGGEHSAAAYKAGRCRCEVCTAEWAAVVKAYRRRHGTKPRAEGWGEPQHGERPKYVQGCRCEACREANRVYSREQYAKRTASKYVEQQD